MSSEQKGSRDKPGNSTAQETPPETTESEPAKGRAKMPKRRRFRMSRRHRSSLLSSGLPDVLPVTCGDVRGDLHVRKFGSGFRGPCISYNGMWVTPNQFEKAGGQGNTKCWKRSIRHERTPLHTYAKLGLITLHRRNCDCESCTTPLVVMGNKETTAKQKKPKAKYHPRAIEIESGSSSESEENSQRSHSAEDIYRSPPSRRGRGKSTVNSVRKAGQARSEPMIDEHQGVSVRAFVKARTQSSKESEATETRLKRGGLFGGLPSKKQRKRQQEQDDDDDSDEGETATSSLQRTTASPEKVARDMADDDSKADKHSGGGLSPDSTQCPSASVHRIQRSRDLQLVASATAALKQGSRVMLTACKLQSLPCLPSLSKSDGEASNTPTTQHDGQESTVPKGNDSTGAGFAADSTNHVPSPQELALRERVSAIMDKAGLSNCDIESWSVDQVAAFVDAAGFRFQSAVFRQQLINGEALLWMQERHLVENMKLKLGTSLRLNALIRCLINKPSSGLQTKGNLT